jgi:hypothetical protein
MVSLYFRAAQPNDISAIMAIEQAPKHALKITSWSHESHQNNLENSDYFYGLLVKPEQTEGRVIGVRDWVNPQGAYASSCIFSILEDEYPALRRSEQVLECRGLT